MDKVVIQLARARAMGALGFFFFLSGAAGLTYQTLWGRQLQLEFGTSMFAIATVLAAFMGGLALGGAWMGRRADRVARPLTWYGVLEVGIGLYALVFPTLLDALGPIHAWVWQQYEPGPLVFAALRGGLVGLLLVPPTAAMGATLPVLARFATSDMSHAGADVGRLYALNTLGAVFGTWLSGFVLLPSVGLSGTTLAVASLNLVLGGASLAMDRWLGEAAQEPVRGVPDLTPVAFALRGSTFLAGFATMVYEVAWFRMLGLQLGASVYSFALMLLVFLTGLAIGGSLGGRLGDRVLARWGTTGVRWALAFSQLAVAAGAWLTMQLWPSLPIWYVRIYELLSAGDQVSLLWMVGMILAFAIMLVPTTIMGLTFPLTMRAAMTSRQDVGADVGSLYAWNTVGGLFGAALGGFVLVPLLQMRGAIWLAMALSILAGAVVVGRAGITTTRIGRRYAVSVAVVVAAIAVLRVPWDPLWMTAGMYKYASRLTDTSAEGIRSYVLKDEELLLYREGPSSVVTVARSPDDDLEGGYNYWLANNGKVDASLIDMPTQVLLSILPLQFRPEPERVMVIGLASGITAGVFTQLEGLQQLDVVELEPAIVEAARFFDEHNHQVLDDPRTRLIVNDGRHQVHLSEEGSYDLVVAEPSNPWISGVSNLFTKEFFESGRSKLAPGGVWVQWMQLYGLATDDLLSLIGTFSDVYPHVALFAVADDADFMMIGSDEPIELSRDAIAELLAHPSLGQHLREIEMGTEARMLAAFVTGREGMQAAADDVVRNTDDNMRIEYNAPLNLHRDQQSFSLYTIYSQAMIPWEATRLEPLFLDELAEAYYRLEDYDRAIAAMIAAALLEPELADVRLEVAFDWYVELQDDGVEPDATRRAVLERTFRLKRVQPVALTLRELLAKEQGAPEGATSLQEADTEP